MNILVGTKSSRHSLSIIQFDTMNEKSEHCSPSLYEGGLFTCKYYKDEQHIFYLEILSHFANKHTKHSETTRAVVLVLKSVLPPVVREHFFADCTISPKNIATSNIRSIRLVTTTCTDSAPLCKRSQIIDKIIWYALLNIPRSEVDWLSSCIIYWSKY